MYQLYLESLNIVKDCGRHLQSDYIPSPGILQANGRDIKTDADKFAHDFITSRLKKFNIPILSEEDNHSVDILSQLSSSTGLIIVDPLDGTFNCTRGFPFFCISLAFWAKDVPVFGIIYDLNRNALYQSFSDQGSHLNDQIIEVSRTSRISDAALATGFPNARSFSEKSLLKSLNYISSYKKVRAIGSAALSLAFVAEGILDAYYEEDIYIWDVAAGLSLVQEAGGTIKLTKGSNSLTYNVYASNGHLR